MKLNLMSALLLSGVMFSSNIALANHHEAGEAGAHKEHKSSADVNKDGKITFEEFKLHNESQTKKNFDRMDTNKDGTLDEVELKAIHEMGNKCEHHNMHKDQSHKEPTDNKT